jgi:hypothetical protein
MQRTHHSTALILAVLLTLSSICRSAEPVIGKPTIVDGVASYSIESDYQNGPNRLDVLLPARMEAGKQYSVIYVLPVAAGPGEDRNKWGTGLDAIRGENLLGKPKENLADKYGVICVFPVFDTTPWYGDNLTNPKIRHESYLMKVVLPFIERTYPAIAEPRGRLLLGFSKSGWGAVSLLLRHPDVFGRAAAFDAPLMAQWPGAWGIAEHFGTKESFDPGYIPRLLETQAPNLKGSSRIVLIGYDNFRDHMERADALMTKLEIPHEYHDGPKRRHHWNSGWVPGAVEFLVK